VYYGNFKGEYLWAGSYAGAPGILGRLIKVSKKVFFDWMKKGSRNGQEE